MPAEGGEDREYYELLRRLYSARRFGVRLGLERIGALLRRLGSPERHYPSVQIAGTNGKGSTAAYLAAMLERGGYRVGVTLSPHLHQLGERLAVNGEIATHAELCCAGRALVRAGGAELTFFEQITAMALWHFAAKKVDVAVLEVGLGGRLDATSAVAAAVSAVTGVDLDHQDILGADLETIAAEKAAIARRGVPFVIGCSGDPRARPWVKEQARRAGAAPLVTVGDEHFSALPATLGLPGSHQQANAAAAWAALDALEGTTDLRVDAAVRRAAIAATELPARLESLPQVPGLRVDGAHNPAAAAALARELSAGTALVFGCARDKDLRGMRAALAPIAGAWITLCADSERGWPAGELAASLRAAGSSPVEAASCPADAIERARRRAGGGPIVATGSLLVAAAVRAEVLGIAGDPLVLRDPLGGVAGRPEQS